MLNGQPVLEFYDVQQTSKWGALGYESLFFVFFFLAGWTVSILPFSTLLVKHKGRARMMILAFVEASLESKLTFMTPVDACTRRGVTS